MNRLSHELAEFLRTGRLGPIDCTATRSSLLSALGEPSFFEGELMGAPFWYYGQIGINFDADKISVYGIYFSKLGYPSWLPFRDYPSNETLIEDFGETLLAAGITFQARTEGASAIALRLKSGVKVVGRLHVASIIVDCTPLPSHM